MRYHDFPTLLEEWYIERLRATYQERAERLASLHTPEDVYRYRDALRGNITQAFGSLPSRTPLNARTWRETDHGAFRIAHVTFESRPEVLVTANLYLPTAPRERVPGILFPCGHSATGKAHPLYVDACVRLAHAGYAVLIYDPINQGERDVYHQLETGGRLTRSNNCDGHNILGRQLQAAGDWFGAWRLWDGLRALDFLAAHAAVDPDQLAITGQSGGGTLSAYLWAMDHRLRAVASGCWCTSYLHDLENSMPADDEQYPPDFFTAGLDKIDFFLSRAGEPTLLLGQELDFFDDRGLHHGYAELQRLHLLAGGNPDRCCLTLDTGTHAYSAPNQLAMLAFFNKVFGKPAPGALTALPTFTEDDLCVLPARDVTNAGSRPVYALVAAQAQGISDARPPVTPEALPQVIRQALAMPATEETPAYRRLFYTATTREHTGQQVYRFLVETAPGIRCVLRHVCREGTPFRLQPQAQTVLYLPNLDSQQELAAPELLPGMEDYWMLDVRGLGEGLYTQQDPYQLYGHDYMLTAHAQLYGETMLGLRLTDVLRTLRLLRAEGARQLSLIGRKQGAILALLAGILDPEVTAISSREAPESFLALATAPFTFWPSVNFPRGVLQSFDLPQVREALGERLLEDTRGDVREFADVAQGVPG